MADNPSGRARHWSPAALDQKVNEDAANVDDAAKNWRRVAPDPFKNLLDAQPPLQDEER